jgi:hypothetical protein
MKRRQPDLAPLLNALLASVAIVSALNVWHYTMEFSGSAWAWAAAAGFAFALIVSLAVLIYTHWR